MATDLFLEMAELPATGSLGTGQLDTRDLLVAGVLISISSKYLYLYLALKVLTRTCTWLDRLSESDVDCFASNSLPVFAIVQFVSYFFLVKILSDSLVAIP